MSKFFKLPSPAFRRGVSDGFGAPIYLFTPLKPDRFLKIDSSLGGAWMRVGVALDNANKAEGQRVGKAAGKFTKKDRVAA